MPLTDLPAGLAEPLHMLGPEIGTGGGPGLLALVAGGLAWLFFRRRRSRAQGRPEPYVPPSRQRPKSGLEAKVEELRSVFTTTGNYRKGCHALAEAVRRALSPRVGVSFEALTAGEITREIGDGAVARVLVMLEGLQFRPTDPSLDEFTQACDLAVATARNAREIQRS